MSMKTKMMETDSVTGGIKSDWILLFIIRFMNFLRSVRKRGKEM